ncbi:potassium channel family protein [Dongshaea marina]|uniref:potassium channel family protein n=1 Tax=Dongshaea marina TaxID=2047966 RepID=UPI000D3EDB6F|nr:TrkA family potassium uptake protein [Dongshaea marina]
MANKQFAVIGLGRFGTALCQELSLQNVELMAIDIDGAQVKNVADIATHSLRADTTDEAAVKELGLEAFDIVFVAIGDNVKASILTTLILKEAGIRSVWVKAKNKNHARILQKIGADKVINPERAMGQRIAHSMVDRRVFDSLDLGSNLQLTEMVITSSVSGIRLDAHPLFGVPELILLALKRGPKVYAPLEPDLELLTSDILIFIGPREVIQQQLSLL